jgi:hypothetical protein
MVDHDQEQKRYIALYNHAYTCRPSIRKKKLSYIAAVREGLQGYEGIPFT